MSKQTITLSEGTQKRFSSSQLEKFINSSDFEDLVLGYQMIQGKTGEITSYNVLKKELGFSK